MEEWKEIEWYDGRYHVSNLGRVKRLGNATRREIIMALHISNGYLKVRLRYRGRFNRFWIHRLVARAFIQNPDNKPIVNHKDRNRLNNNVENLEWVDAKENSAHWINDEKVKHDMAF